MKNKFLKILGVISILFILLFPYKNTFANAYTPGNNFYKIGLEDLGFNFGNNDKKNTIEYTLNNRAKIHFTYNKDRKKHEFIIHEFIDKNNLSYIAYCLHAGKTITSLNKVEIYGDFNELKNSAGEEISSEQKMLLENIIISGYKGPDGTPSIAKEIFKHINANDNGQSLSICSDKNKCKKIIATQILIWEVVEGNRKGYGYDEVEYKNEESGIPDFILGNLGTEYKRILDDARDLTTTENVDAFNKTYTLHWIPSTTNPKDGHYAYSTWDDNDYNYKEKKINVGSYKYEKAEKSKVDVTNDGYIRTEAPLMVNEKLVTEDLKFSLMKGSTKLSSFMWFHIKNDNSDIEYQDLLRGDGSRTYEGKLTVKTESALLHLRKFDYDTKKPLPGAKFELYYCGYSQRLCDNKFKPDLVDTITITESDKDNTVRIYKSGYYMFKEATTPEGYEPMQIVYAKLQITDNKDYPVIIKDVNKYHNSYDCIKIGKTADGKDGYIDLYNRERTYTIKKIDGNTGDPVNGATFQIKNSKDNTIKFNKKSDGNFIYDKNGKLYSLYEEKMSVYTFSGLPTGNYKLVETNVPQPYSMASKIEDRTKYFKVKKDYSMCETDNKYNCIGQDITEFTYKNYTTCVTIQKSGNNGDLLPGVVFELYDKSQTNRVLLTKTEDGVYTYTTDKNVSPIELETNSKGKFTINNLPTGTSTETYYLKEIKAPIGYEITEENEWTEIDVEMDDAGSCINISISNAKGTFNFYKIDEDGNYLSAGIFKLQSYNEDSGKYEDQSLTYDEENDTYSIDEKGDSDIYTFTPNNGIVTFVNVSKTGKYRIVEIEAPEGFVLPNTNDAYVEFVVNASGYVSGDLTMINKKIVTGEGAQAQAELVINIQTGQDRIHYILIISVLAICIIGLIFLSKKINKK